MSEEKISELRERDAELMAENTILRERLASENKKLSKDSPEYFQLQQVGGVWLINYLTPIISFYYFAMVYRYCHLRDI